MGGFAENGQGEQLRLSAAEGASGVEELVAPVFLAKHDELKAQLVAIDIRTSHDAMADEQNWDVAQAEGSPTGNDRDKVGLSGCPTMDETASTCTGPGSLWNDGVENFRRQISSASDFRFGRETSTTSDFRFTEPAQTMIVFDWDDTLFPTTDLIQSIGVRPDRAEEEPLKGLAPEVTLAITQWEEALYEYLSLACSLSDRCVIITNSRRPWVEDCVNKFAPRLKPLFERVTSGPKVVYANERLRRTKTLRSQCQDLRPVLHRDHDLQRLTDAERMQELTMAKYEAMKSEAQEFYSLYTGQSWKNILSIGDMSYEHDALQELSFKRSGPSHERLRTKAIILPTEPTISELTLRLSFSRVMLCAYVHFDGDFDIDLTTAREPLQAIADALHLPVLAQLPFSKHAWGLESAPPLHEEVAQDLAELATTVYSSVFD
jgi:hypothetical protein